MLEHLSNYLHLSLFIDCLNAKLNNEELLSATVFRDFVKAGHRKNYEVWQLIDWSITLRNRISHDGPTDPEWWNEAAILMSQIFSFWKNATRTVPIPAKKWPRPWFNIINGELLSFNGMDRSSVPRFVSRKGVSHSCPDRAASILSGFKSLLGQKKYEDETLRQYLKKYTE
ncbi:MAG: hypothetical protein R3C11_29540 [Planctomycetaceae bacterium]